MAAQQGGRLDDDGGAQEPARVEEYGPKPEPQPDSPAKVGGAPTGPLQNQQLLFEQEVFGQEGFGSPGSEQHGHWNEQVGQQNNCHFHHSR